MDVTCNFCNERTPFLFAPFENIELRAKGVVIKVGLELLAGNLCESCVQDVRNAILELSEGQREPNNGYKAWTNAIR